ncbi:MAG TPA: nickel pincer cofactor biosynthesis protein LarC [Kamptonema sp.]|nr:nickel pincer cofactor biosynthesis protein LarC [Kamptonema sp.]
MNKIAYFECPTGIAGDMCLGALVHAGVPIEYLIAKLNLLGISQEYHLRAEKVHRNTQLATKVYVDLSSSPETTEVTGENIDPSERESPTFSQHHHHHHTDSPSPTSHSQHRHLPEIELMIASAGLPQRAETWSLAVFRKLAEAEGAVHGIAPEKVHFHEVGATDAIVDIVGTCLGLDWLDIDELYCSALPTGGGTVWAAHGQLVVPTPAVLKLWEMRQVPVYSNGIERELCTPTGSAIAVTLCQSFGSPPPMNLQKIGLGAGSRQLPIPNILRLWIGEKEEGRRKKEEGRGKKEEGRRKREEGRGKKEEIKGKNEERRDKREEGRGDLANCHEIICVLETQIDDLSPQAIAYIFDALFKVGALDVFTQPIVMKKSRLGVLLTIICHPKSQQKCESVIFRETTTLGIRRSTQIRKILHREIQKVQIDCGEVRVKVAKTGDAITNVQPEYEDCAELARLNNISWREVHRMALQSWHVQNNKPF